MGVDAAFPEEGELVICSVQNVKNFGAYVTLDEYGGREGFVHIAEVATGWIKYIRDFIREGQKIVCKVLSVNEEKGQINLSLKQVNDHQRREKIQEWKNEQKARVLLGIVGERIGWSEEKCWDEFGRDLAEAFGTLYGAFEDCALDPEILKEEDFSGEWNEAFVEVAQENITPPFVRIDGHVELSCPAPDGALHIRKALMAAQKDDHVKVAIQYVGAPRYRIVVTAPEYKLAEEEMLEAANRAIELVRSAGGDGKFHRRE